MKFRWTEKRQSVSVKLTVYIFLLVALIFVVALANFYHTSCKKVKEVALTNAQSVLTVTENELKDNQRKVELVAENMSWLIPHFIEDQDSLYKFTQQEVLNNSFIYGCALAFEPDFFDDEVLFAPYSYRKGDSICTKQLGTAEYNYIEKEWFYKVKGKKKGMWSKPYYDQHGGEKMMLTYSQPIYDNKGNFYAVFTVDITLDELERQIHQMNPFPYSYSFVLNQKGDYIVRPNDIHLVMDNIFDSAENTQKEDLAELGKRMSEGNFGNMVISRKGESYLIFYTPIKDTEWVLAVASRERDLFDSVMYMTRNFWKEAFLGLFLLVVVCYFVIRQMMAPLKDLTQSAVEIAAGDFDAKLPKVKGQDEIAALCYSFDFMKKSLVSYMEELKQTTIKNERLNSELRIAGEIQKDMVPRDFPRYPTSSDLDVYALLVPARTVGGDFYQFLIKDDCFYFIVGDVSGKGVPAALVMSSLCHIFRMVANSHCSPTEIVRSVNTSLTDNNDSEMFCTAFVGVLHLETGLLEFCNAGHNASVVIPLMGTAHYMSVIPNLPLGVLEDFPYQAQKMQLQPGDALLLYTDGVTEAENNLHELYSEKRLLKNSDRLKEVTSVDFVEAIYRSVLSFAEGAEQSDDITMLCLNYQPRMKASYRQ